MPETTPEGANVAAFRWRNEMWVRSRQVSERKWQVLMMEDPRQFDKAEQLVRAATGRFASKDRS